MNRVFVETGTYDGRTVRQALDCGFEEIYSIEIDPNLCSEAMARFRENSKVNILQGDSLEMLVWVMNNLSCPATFWLDAHIQDSAVVGTVMVPLLQEIALIEPHFIKTHTIMIDDVRLFGAEPYWSNISIEKILALLDKINPKYNITFENSKVKEGDIMVAYI